MVLPKGIPVVLGVLLLLATSANAATVEVFGHSGILSGAPFTTPFNATFDVMEAADVTVTLTDQVSPGPFANLWLFITSSTSTGPLAQIHLMDGGLTTDTNVFAALPGVDYFVNVIGETGAVPFGLFAVSAAVQIVPVPAALWLMGSALAGLMALGRSQVV